jgi:hypothetical protein
MARDRGWRHWRRHVVKWRRLKSDFNEHYINMACACRTDAKTQALFADTPTRCSNPMCCGNPRRIGEVTVQERRHPLEYTE